jgi:hypothetical protein
MIHQNNNQDKDSFNGNGNPTPLTIFPRARRTQGGEKVGGVVGANAPEITSQVMALNAGGGAAAPGPSPAAVPAAPAPTKAFAPAGAAEPAEDLNTRLGKLINQAPIMLFMKGSPGAEKCGFSRKTVRCIPPFEPRMHR